MSLAPEAFIGPLGQWVCAQEHLTESDPVALLALALGALGFCLGDTEDIQGPGGQPLTEFILLIGDERARVEDAWDRVVPLFSTVWGDNWERPPKRHKSRRSRKAKRAPQEAADSEGEAEEGPTRLLQDRRLPPQKGWFAWAGAWRLGTGSILAWSRREEALRLLTNPQATNSGLLSRTLLLRAVGGKALPLGDAEPDDEYKPVFLDVVNGLEESKRFAEQPLHANLRLTPEAEALWKIMDPVLREPRNAGHLVGVPTELAEKHVLRVAALYAVNEAKNATGDLIEGEGRLEFLKRKGQLITVDHLLAALAIWDHHEATAYWLFANQTGERDKDRALHALRERHPEGLTTDDVGRWVLQGNRKGGAGKILKELEEDGLVLPHRGAAQRAW